MMRLFVRSGLALVGLSTVLAPASTFAQMGAPAGYAPVAASAPGTMMMVGPDGKPVAMAPAAGSAAPTAAKHTHKHKLRTVCAGCAKKQEDAMAGAKIVACAHSKNGVCPACRTLLEMPGTVTMGAPMAAPAPNAEAPGRAMVSSGPAGQPGMNPNQPQYAAQAAVYDPSMTPEPTPIGVMQTNYARPGMMPAAPAAGGVPTASSMMPGHGLAGTSANPAPYQHKPTSSANPHVVGHLLGLKSLGSDWREQRDRRKTEAHASIPYNTDGTTINELPASVVYGGKH